MNHYETKYSNIIKYLASETKSLNIVSQHIREFKSIEHYVSNLMELPIVITNNRRRALIRAKYIINIDFNEKMLNEFNINNTAIILNISNNEIKKINLFNGTIVNNIVVKKKKYKNYFENQFNNIYQRKTFEDVIVSKLIGNNGIIPTKELTMK